MIEIVELGRIAPQPWRNGGGITRDLLAWPTADHWQLRISVAEVARDGPFSAYPGVDRWFAVVRGAGVVLHFGNIDRRLTPQSEPLHFDGASAPGCTLIDGVTQDLNLLVRQDAGHGQMTRALPGADWLGAAPLRAVFTSQAAELQVAGRPVAALPAGSLAWSTAADGLPWQLVADDALLGACWLSFTAHQP